MESAVDYDCDRTVGSRSGVPAVGGPPSAAPETEPRCPVSAHPPRLPRLSGRAAIYPPTERHMSRVGTDDTPGCRPPRPQRRTAARAAPLFWRAAVENGASAAADIQ